MSTDEDVAVPTPRAVVEAYFAGVTAGDPAAVAGLFAPDAVLVNAAGTLSGADAIARMYSAGLSPGAMVPRPWRWAVDGDTVAVEIDLVAHGQQISLADFFTVRDGRIQRLAIYSLNPAGGRLLDDVGADPAATTGGHP